MLLSSLLLKSILKSLSKPIYKPVSRNRGCRPGKSACVESQPQPWHEAGRKNVAAPMCGGTGALRDVPWVQGDLWALGTGLSLELQKGTWQPVGKGKGPWKDGRLISPPCHCAPEPPTIAAVGFVFLGPQRGCVCSRSSLGGFWWSGQSDMVADRVFRTKTQYAVGFQYSPFHPIYCPYTPAKMPPCACW